MITSISNQNLPSIAEDKQYLLVHLNGKVEFNIDGILECLVNKKIWNYPSLTTHMTMMNQKQTQRSFLYHSLLSMISHSTQVDGWFNAEWKQMFGTELNNQRADVVFYDEFCFLLSEGLIRFDDYEALTDEDIWRNVGVDINKNKKQLVSEYPQLQPLLDAKNSTELRAAYRKLVLEWHPDRVGENEIIRMITSTFLKLKKK